MSELRRFKNARRKDKNYKTLKKYNKNVNSVMYLLLENYVTGRKRLNFLEIFIVPFCPTYDSEDKISLQIF